MQGRPIIPLFDLSVNDLYREEVEKSLGFFPRSTGFSLWDSLGTDLLSLENTGNLKLNIAF